MLFRSMESYEPNSNAVFSGAMPLKELYGKFPDIIEIMAIVRNIYGDDFMEIFEKSFTNIDSKFTDENGKLEKKSAVEKELA